MKIYGIMLIIMVALSGQDKRNVCRYLSYEAYYGGLSTIPRVVGVWKYDSIGRLILDSISSEDPLVYSRYPVEYFRYSGDSIIGTNTLVILNKKGFPLYYRNFSNRTATIAEYTYNTMLTGIKMYVVGENGKLSASLTVNKIEYDKDGNIFKFNILDYRLSEQGKNSEIVCTYYKDRSAEVLPVKSNKEFGLFSFPLSTGYVYNIQAFSKNLLSTYEVRDKENYSVIRFNYFFDRMGYVTTLTRSSYDRHIGESTTKFILSHDCK